MAKTTKTTNPVVADICLYGNSQIGAGWLVAMNPEVVVVPVGSKGLIGTGDPVEGQSFTEAVFQAMDHVLAAAGQVTGQVRIFHPGGETMTVVQVGDFLNYGTLVSRRVPAVVYVVPVDALMAAAGPAF